MTNIGEQLLQPEAGWKRISLGYYDYACETENLSIKEKDYAYNKKVYYDTNSSKPSSIKFVIYSKKFRFISKVDYESNVKNSVKIDYGNGETDLADQYQDGNTVKGVVLQAEHIFDDYIHYITISSENNGYMWVDSIDIDEDGYILYSDKDGKLYFDVTPIMTSNTTPAPYVATTNSEYDSAHSIWYLFDGNLDPNAAWATTANSVSNIYATLLLDKMISNIYIRGCSNNKQNPKDISILGSNDNTTFDNILDYQIDIPNNGDLFLDLKTSKYKYYKLLCKNNNGANNIALVELRFLLYVDTPFFLINDNGIYKNYNEETNSLVTVEDTSILNESTLNNTCIYDISKINSLLSSYSGVKLLCNKEGNYKINGVKSKEELFISSYKSSLKIAESMNSLSLIENKSDNVIIKTAIKSLDDKFYIWNVETSSWDALDNTCVDKNIEDMTQDELNNYNLLKQEIKEKGNTSDQLSNVDLKSLSEYIRFAHYISIYKTSDEGIIKEIKWNYKESAGYIKLDNSDVIVKKIKNKYIKIHPNRDIPEAKIEVVKTFKNTSGESIINTTEEEMKNKISSGWEV